MKNLRYEKIIQWLYKGNMNLIMYIIYLQKEDMLFCEPSEISKIQERNAGTIVLKWQQHILKQLIHGI